MDKLTAVHVGNNLHLITICIMIIATHCQLQNRAENLFIKLTPDETIPELITSGARFYSSLVKSKKECAVECSDLYHCVLTADQVGYNCLLAVMDRTLDLQEVEMTALEDNSTVYIRQIGNSTRNDWQIHYNTFDGCVGGPCENGGTCRDGVGHDNYTCSCVEGYMGLQCQTEMDCGDFTSGITTNDNYTSYTDIDGWTVFQRRIKGCLDFYQNWTSYQAGFGNLTGEFWWGLDKLANITATRPHKLRVEMSDFDGATAWAEYSEFVVGPESDNYRLTVSGYSGTAGDSLNPSSYILNGRQFTTPDRDNDDWVQGNCAQLAHGAFWWRNCARANPNGRYFSLATENWEGVFWYTWKNSAYSMKTFSMKLRPLDY